MAIDIKKIEEDLKTGKYKEAGDSIKDLLKENLSENEKGVSLVGLTCAYMELINTLNQEYLDKLNAMKNNLVQMVGIDEEVADMNNLLQVRTELSK